jgi:ubiquinone/menaquinone biosynthesis C-methylase UbiE
MSQQTTVDVARLRSAIQDEYTDVATYPAKGFHFHTGRPLASRLGYPMDRVAALPDSVVESFAGVGNPFAWGEPAPGESVLDLGSGAGFDILLAARMVGPHGRAIGVDMTPAMTAKARRNAGLLGLTNVDIREGYLEDLPVDDDSIDLVISNGVLNLCPDKGAVLRETYRVLKPGGRLQLSDIVVGRGVPEDARDDISLWTGCIAGALMEPELDGALKAAGFTEITFSAQRYDAFSEAPQESSAAEFDTLGVNIFAAKPQ